MAWGSAWRWARRNKWWVFSGVLMGILAVAAGFWTLNPESDVRSLPIPESKPALKPKPTPEPAKGKKEGAFTEAELLLLERIEAELEQRSPLEVLGMRRRLGADAVRASRLFAGPGQYPPREFAAYGIVAFRSAATEHDRDRYLLVCEAYTAVLPHTSELPGVPPEEQMVTVWPVKTEAVADELNAAPREGICQRAVDTYDVVTARLALHEAEAAGVWPYRRGNGPYLLAWSPGVTKGAPDAPVLVADLSYITDYQRIREVFIKWADDIEQKPELWRQGWHVERVRQVIRVWADRFGSQILAFVVGES